ncbi:MAG TPA: hypothetical protein VFE05_06015 [Longimicrobiaceae bacterium]|jgi:hypothetical protein|nr:hypothetical protein [Longimicrobiaceae bacterium]
MKKLSLNVEALDVETFETTDALQPARGTVNGQAGTNAYPCVSYGRTCGAQPFLGGADAAITICM